MLHCAVGHWGSLTHANTISAMGWVKQWQDMSTMAFQGTILSMLEGARPVERGALVVAGAAFPKDLELRRWLVSRLKRVDLELRIAVVYALAAHLDEDEDLASLFLITSLKAKHADPGLAFRVALQQVLSIWRASNGSGRCDECGKPRG